MARDYSETVTEETLEPPVQTAESRQAANLFFRLSELANARGTASQFAIRLDRLKAKYSRRTTLMRELRRVQL
ncbi:MAG: hypothetical protein R3A44_08990 [Caldilineaceae bacterium]